eukprot:2049340-Pyramimonas_sp.AAC.1
MAIMVSPWCPLLDLEACSYSAIDVLDSFTHQLIALRQPELLPREEPQTDSPIVDAIDAGEGGRQLSADRRQPLTGESEARDLCKSTPGLARK